MRVLVPAASVEFGKCLGIAANAANMGCMKREDLSSAQLPAVIARNERIIEGGFWKKFARLAGRIPFAEDLAAAYFCATDPATPSRVKAVLLAAIAYFVVPLDAVPDFLAGFGLTDDAAVLAAALSMVAGHINPSHREKAQKLLETWKP